MHQAQTVVLAYLVNVDLTDARVLMHHVIPERLHKSQHARERARACARERERDREITGLGFA